MSNTTQKRRSRLTVDPIGSRKRRGLPSLGTAGPDLQPSGEVKTRKTRKKHFTHLPLRNFHPRSPLHAALAKNLDKLMEKKGVYRAQLAKELGTQRSSVTKWLQGASWPEDDAINAMLAYFKIKKEDLIPDLPEEELNMAPLVPKGYTIKSVGKDRSHIMVNEEVPKEIAYKILGLLDNMNEVQENEQKEQ